MATVRRETIINADPEEVWDAVRDVGSLHTRLAPGVVEDTVLDSSGDHPVRTVTFASGQRLRERIVAVDDRARRLVWSIEGSPVLHHNGALQVQEIGARQSRVVWTADVLPDTLAEAFAPLMEAGLAAMTRHLQD
jgi:carbon monoxide dehydrogenase subunit G